MQGFFRKAAIEKMSSPEQLDLMMRVTSPVGWLALLTMGVILLVAGVWSVFGSIPDLVDGQGVLMRGERLYEVKISMTGTISELDVQTGSMVKAGQVIAKLNLERGSDEERQADEINISRNESMLKIKQGELNSLRRQRAVQADLVRRGLKAGNTLYDADRRISATLEQINQIERDIAVSRTRLKSTVEMTSPEAGRVVEVLKSYGDKVGEGEPLIRMELARGAGEDERRFCGGKTHALLYVSSRLAGKVQVGQEARISPLDVKREEYGYIEGKVAWISSYAASPDDMKEKLKNEALVQSYNREGPVFEVRACLEEDPNNKANGLKWSSSTGPDREISSGVQCSASVVVDSRRPYTYVIPAVKRATGL